MGKYQPILAKFNNISVPPNFEKYQKDLFYIFSK